MRLSKATALILIFVIVASFAGVVMKQRNANFLGIRQCASESAQANAVSYTLLSFPISTNHLAVFLPSSVSYVIFAETAAPALNNATRAEIYSFVKANPGVQFRGICSALGLSVGLVQFHLGVLTRKGLVSFFRDGKYKRFFEAKRFSKKQMKIISVLRHETAGCILRVLLERKSAAHSELAHELSVTSQGLTWHMNRLEQISLVVGSKENKKQMYSIDCASAPLLSEMAKLLR